MTLPNRRSAAVRLSALAALIAAPCATGYRPRWASPW